MKDAVAVENGSSRKPAARRKESDLRYLAASVDIDEPINIKSLGGVTYAIAGLVIAFLVWASIANIHAVTRTNGEVAPAGSMRIIQHQTGGVVEKILVEDGQQVNAGETLILLGGDGLDEDLRQAREKQRTLRAREERFRAFLDGRSPDFTTLQDRSQTYIDEQTGMFLSMRTAIEQERAVLEEQRLQKRQLLAGLHDQLDTVARNRALTEEIHKSRKELSAKGRYPRVQVLETERELNELAGAERRLASEIELAETTLAEYDQRLDLQDASARDKAYVALDEITAELAQVKEAIDKLEGRIESLAVTSPVRGLVKALSVNSAGGVVAPGQAIAEIVPLDEELIVQIRISPKDIGRIATGHTVDVKFSAYDYSRLGSVRGKLVYVSATTFSGQNGERYYRGKVSLEKSYVGDDPDRHLVIPGMTVTADIILGDRTLLEHILSPARNVADRAFRE